MLASASNKAAMLARTRASSGKPNAGIDAQNARLYVVIGYDGNLCGICVIRRQLPLTRCGFRSCGRSGAICQGRSHDVCQGLRL